MAEEKTKKSSPKLHELLATLGDLEARSKMTQDEATVTFDKRATHFIGSHRTLKMFDDKDSHLEDADEQHQALTTTVGAKLKYIQKDIARWFDAFLQKEATNQVAKADLVVGDKVLIKDAPATFFLGMEKELKQLRKTYEAIPTLQPGVEWVKDEVLAAEDNSKGVYRNANSDKKLKTKQTIGHVVLVPSSVEHPAQIEKWKEQVPVGEFTQENYCGMISPADKSVLLNRVSKLISAVKRARQRANSTDIQKLSVGKAIFKYIHSTDEE